MSSRGEVIRVFLAENQENMGRVENDLLLLEKDASRSEERRVGKECRL